jgi:hypothetical protein
MNRTSALIAGVLPLLLGTAAFAQSQDPQISGTVRAPETLPGELTAPPQQPPFTIGQMPVRIWAPLPPPYDVSADRTGADDPLWMEPQ